MAALKKEKKKKSLVGSQYYVIKRIDREQHYTDINVECKMVKSRFQVDSFSLGVGGSLQETAVLEECFSPFSVIQEWWGVRSSSLNTVCSTTNIGGGSSLMRSSLVCGTQLV